jgi:PhzF family phenazine biosynthesis protein
MRCGFKTGRQIRPSGVSPMKLNLWQVDAFATRVFQGNPAAIVALQSWLPERTMQAIAQENNLAETAFFVRRGKTDYDLRWFTPSMEVPMCGHATLASAWLIFSELAPEIEVIRFATQSGTLTVERSHDECHRMSLPAGKIDSFDVPSDFAGALAKSLSVPPPVELHVAPKGAGGTRGIIAVWSESLVRDLQPSGLLAPLLASVDAGGLLATSRCDSGNYDFVSRFLAPGMGVPEDPVTGSMHASLAPFWAERLGKSELHAFQASARGGELYCVVDQARVVLSGPCSLYLRGEIDL